MNTLKRMYFVSYTNTETMCYIQHMLLLANPEKHPSPRDPANTRSPALDATPLGRFTHNAHMFTRSGEYIHMLRRSFSTRTVHASRCGCSHSSLSDVGSIDGKPWIHALRWVGIRAPDSPHLRSHPANR